MKPIVPLHLESSRLLLRQFGADDWQPLHRYYGDPEAMRFIQGRALTQGETWRTVSSLIGHWQLRGYGPYAVVEKASDRVLGSVGFWYPNDWPEPEIKWGLARPYWGRGFASEAARAVLAAAAEFLPDVALISLVHDDNRASIRLALAVGAHHDGSLDFDGEPHGVYRHDSDARQATDSIK